MNLKGFISMFEGMREDFLVAHKTRHCDPPFRDEIRKWNATGAVPDIGMAIPFPSGNDVLRITCEDLVHVYNMKTIVALFFLDDLYKAHKKGDWRLIHSMLSRLNYINASHKLVVDEGFLNKIQSNSPSIWALYEKIDAEAEEKMRNH